MASTLLGRSACPECGFAHAHVKISDKENAKAYRHCPECGAQYFPRNQAQADRLLAKTRAEGSAPPEPAAPAPIEAPPAPIEAPPAPGYRYVLGVKVPL
jgi:predicted RNA-binding Zn-ribbon protein involved in translation (DUF1610 family)